MRSVSPRVQYRSGPSGYHCRRPGGSSRSRQADCGLIQPTIAWPARLAHIQIPSVNTKNDTSKFHLYLQQAIHHFARRSGRAGSDGVTSQGKWWGMGSLLPIARSGWAKSLAQSDLEGRRSASGNPELSCRLQQSGDSQDAWSEWDVAPISRHRGDISLSGWRRVQCPREDSTGTKEFSNSASGGVALDL